MTHSHDRTYLASLGFADKDKREALHDYACEYLTQPDQMKAIVEMFGAPKPIAVSDKIVTRQASGICTRSEISYVPTLEMPIHKGAGQYRTTIGFIDAVVLCVQDITVEEACGESSELQPFAKQINIEVKIGKVSIGDLLRQINLYREFSFGHHWVAAVAFDFTEGEVTQLSYQEVTVVRLRDRFKAWAESRFTSGPAKMKEI